ncbi:MULTISPECIES: Mrp/NBP35 family ATP-binding protein [unclassified Mucilaginibacter]|uniref:Mrp/NBP35 family ATP-binding protein n=1 Tax=unclassified Mucilaginibacter TaxID=2617802 RepID=UPI002AC92095|nr:MULTISPECIES: Mrp/NBP35 family ATP-binding protein [unclassified Mucilaginibacter]MEB0260057.1 Mrp/NBP35 family ATP-binding protein [Mucilaginibacter sp. 10I4]MEB0280561.1 Mrp/NBP35 family ATP-binding protein [Mucilaginibacter sp. 10B2]MEB0301099.1 Mrp/NBP35 family ATP-binding protein [Mucilaginibacter sp. 5C4]WPX22407.1 Mrp/NBP35 family ATP-binding protein [Mucilaginibacter sp. 5C4]
MSEITEDDIIKILTPIIEPDLKRSIIELGLVSGIHIEGDIVTFSVMISSPTMHSKKQVNDDCTNAVRQSLGEHIQLNIDIKALPGVKHRNPELRSLLPGVKHIIAIASGKGGVGKSTVAANLAVALSLSGARVGLLDADIYGPSMPLMFNLVNRKPIFDNTSGRNMMEPIQSHGVGILSIGFFAEASQAVPWRGPMVSKALMQLFQDADWGSLDYLLVDLPPGTGDIHLTLVDKIPLTGAIVVSTPQEVALADARKGISMFQMPTVNVAVLGLVENMAYYVPEGNPDKKDYIFGQDGAKKLADQMKVPLLGQIPLITRIREAGDVGIPAALNENSIEGKMFKDLARNVIECIKNLSAAPSKEKIGV